MTLSIRMGAVTELQFRALEVIARGVGIVCELTLSGEGLRVFLGQGRNRRSFDDYVEAVFYLAKQDLEGDLKEAAGYLQLGMTDDAWFAVEALPVERLKDADVRILRLEILQAMGRWDVIGAFSAYSEKASRRREFCRRCQRCGGAGREP